MALAKNGIYKVTQACLHREWLDRGLPGLAGQGSLTGAHGILRIQSGSNVVLNDAMVFGTGYVWDSNNQQEHGIQIDGGSDITLNHPVTRDTRGD